MIEMKRTTGGKLKVPLTQCYISKYVFHSKISSHAPRFIYKCFLQCYNKIKMENYCLYHYENN